ncbi:LysM peptidoglycan-binding domain-containing protein [Leifsonia xyli]|uniref:LysM peptidoglycan-binding domain-containing protein n=1 Tax=Leifsonia xyli TaxID=1575 RepID=UPI003D66C557
MSAVLMSESVPALRAVPPLPEGAHVRLRITRRGRAVLSALIALPLVIGAFVFALNGGGAIANGEQTHVSFQYVTVESGDSLWSVAERVAPNADPRDVIADIVSLNGLESAVVSPGQQLAVPAKYAK